MLQKNSKCILQEPGLEKKKKVKEVKVKEVKETEECNCREVIVTTILCDHFLR